MKGKEKEKRGESLVLLGLLAVGGRISSGLGSLSAVLVEEELGEENGVREVHDEGEVRAKDELVAVGALQSGGRDDVNADEHLRELQRSEEDVPVGAVSKSRHAVVGVHERVNEQVHDCEGPASAVEIVRNLIRIPAVQRSHHVVVIVQEDQRLLAQHNEERIAELEELGDVKEENPSG